MAVCSALLQTLLGASLKYKGLVSGQLFPRRTLNSDSKACFKAKWFGKLLFFHSLVLNEAERLTFTSSVSLSRRVWFCCKFNVAQTSEVSFLFLRPCLLCLGHL